MTNATITATEFSVDVHLEDTDTDTILKVLNTTMWYEGNPIFGELKDDVPETPAEPDPQPTPQALKSTGNIMVRSLDSDEWQPLGTLSYGKGDVLPVQDTYTTTHTVTMNDVDPETIKVLLGYDPADETPKFSDHAFNALFPTIEGKLTKHDPVKHPKHYTGHFFFMGEAWDHMANLGTLGSHAFKYAYRYQDKHNPDEDLAKCRQYIEKIMAYPNGVEPNPTLPGNPTDVHLGKYVDSNSKGWVRMSDESRYACILLESIAGARYTQALVSLDLITEARSEVNA